MSHIYVPTAQGKISLTVIKDNQISTVIDGPLAPHVKLF